jgi:uracil-DNA glycosylase
MGSYTFIPRVLNKHRDVIHASAVYCGRGSPYGNPFVVGRDGNRDEVCNRFEAEILPTLDVSGLRGKDLVCFCAPLRCHCDAILRKANMTEEITRWLDLPFFQGPVKEVIKKVNANGPVAPVGAAVFTALMLTPLEKVRVVILGQDPYPTPGHANGLAFSVNRGVLPLPKSLANIFQELHDDIGCLPPTYGDLTPWAKQGVLLLNTSLTVKLGSPGSHSDLGWDQLIKEIFDVLQGRDIIYVLWGAHAKKYLPLIRDKSKVIMSAHPSPLSARHGFFNSRPFSKINAMLVDLGQSPIDWTLTNE